MKKSIVFIGIALLSLANICNAANGLEKQKKSFQEEILNEINFSNEIQILKSNFTNRDSTNLEVIESVSANKKTKTTEELFEEDNAITENNISNETQALDFEIINRNSISDEVIECVYLSKIEKTPEELIAEDNAITANNLSNETQALDFEIINRISNLETVKNKTFLVID